VRFRGFSGPSVVFWAMAAIVGVAMLACPVGAHPAPLAVATGCVPASRHRVAAVQVADAPSPIDGPAPARALIAVVPGDAVVGPGARGILPGPGPSGDTLFGRLTI
jgi:hypothetical protein